MKLYLTLMVCSCAQLVLVGGTLRKFKWSTCGSNHNPPIHIHQLDVTPMPMILPGNIYVTVNASLTRPLTNAKLKLSMKRHTFLFDLPLPCMSHLGSCSYNNMCTMMDTMIAENWANSMTEVGRQIRDMLRELGVTATNCTISPRSLHINRYQLHLPGLSSLLSIVAAGDYKIGMLVTEHSTGEDIFCANLEVSIDKAVSGNLFG
ncbi:hypothetical protein ScPMuIL_017112 [Solemya velum]